MKPIERILFIEDIEMERYVMRRLYDECHKCFHKQVELIGVGSWAEAEAQVGLGTVDVLVTDLALMPDSSTEDSILRIKQHSDGVSFPPIVVLTGQEYIPELRERCMIAGASDFVLKSTYRHVPEIFWERVYTAYLRRQSEDYGTDARLHTDPPTAF